MVPNFILHGIMCVCLGRLAVVECVLVWALCGRQRHLCVGSYATFMQVLTMPSCGLDVYPHLGFHKMFALWSSAARSVAFDARFIVTPTSGLIFASARY
jgi:hypothetical protein